mmetsp:Transcript_51936/g.117179  ORF Transcript_51936/g.117179 Transcript_51936/m.117179 type:complete len:270 (+) Transcript_51936:43-852(+)
MAPFLSTFANYWPGSTLPVTFALCSGGFVNIIYSFGLGYGLSMTANAGLAAWVARRKGRTLSLFGLACCGMYAAYGLRLTAFLWRRQSDASYQPKLMMLEHKTTMMELGSRFGIVTGVALSQALYALPLMVATSGSFERAGPLVRGIGWMGLVVAASGLVLEHVADEQKLAAKRLQPNQPLMSGLYQHCRHPNYLGEMLFHCGVCCFAASGPPMQAMACMAAPAFMFSVMIGAARRLDKEGAHRYAEVPGYSLWVAQTPALLPRLVVSE